ncbi:diguanylate cyclase [Aromatoleum toluclasticum]|uniref:diguanylate cyclase domain-containing protein n=1 Tax=Aromatoleum toluclasticum TaxID=92003 RepID=UPI001D187A5A|nr:sensor domain-containing diguanylate cyclase [Aromatoleum toluclasticum]MCC4113767.1 diguanylate cyclase [Aromatoleum toluclasticum]
MDSDEGPQLRRGDNPLYAVLLVAWMLFSVSLFALVLRGAWEDIRSEFHADAEADIELVRDRLRTNDALLSGFAAFLDVLGAPTQEQIAGFASRLLGEHPHIYMLEVVEKVPARARDSFEQALAERAGPGARIGSFNYQDGRRWQAVAEKAAYFPVSFLWPATPESLPVLGLDLDSVPHLRDALIRAEASRGAVSTRPFALIEGPLAYVVMKRTDTAHSVLRPAGADQRYALLVVKADAMVPDRRNARTAHVLRMLGETGPQDPPLYAMLATQPASAVERRTLPKFTLNVEDFSTSQPVRLTVTRQLRFSDIRSEPLLLAIGLAVGTLAVLVLYLSRHRAAVARDRDHLQRATHGALHDPLTGLPNRRLFYDRVEQASAHWRRTGEGFALFFVDLDRFKEVNDRYGHEVGDAVLRTVAERMRGSMRETDTVARIAGDEFVVLLPGVTEHAAAEPVAAKLLAAVAQPVESRDGLVLQLTASLGVSVCPEHGIEPEELIRHADMAMYDDKRAGGAGSHGTPPRPLAKAPRLRVIRKLARGTGGSVMPGGRKKASRGRGHGTG